MTMQCSDKFVFRRQNYVICEKQDANALFEPYEMFGLETAMMSTACYRGYIAMFSLRENALVLTDLLTRVSSPTAPAIGGVMPTVDELPSGDHWELHYRNISHKLPYSGGLIIGRNYIKRLNRRVYHAHPYNYKKVIQLKFENGVVVRANDISPLVASVAGGIKKLEQQGMLLGTYNLFDYWFDIQSKKEWQAEWERKRRGGAEPEAVEDKDHGKCGGPPYPPEA